MYPCKQGGRSGLSESPRNPSLLSFLSRHCAAWVTALSVMLQVVMSLPLIQEWEHHRKWGGNRGEYQCCLSRREKQELPVQWIWICFSSLEGFFFFNYSHPSKNVEMQMCGTWQFPLLEKKMMDDDCPMVFSNSLLSLSLTLVTTILLPVSKNLSTWDNC